MRGLPRLLPVGVVVMLAAPTRMAFRPVSSAAPRILMVPVSSASGVGEYMRCIILADALCARWPGLDVQFLLSRQAPVAASCPYPAHLLARSATLEPAAVDQLLQQLRPDLVIFDCAGRAAQARTARRLGARVVFVSQHRKKRAKGFALGRLIALDAHWITQFQFVDGDLSPLERLKLKLLGKPAPLFLGPVFATPQAQLSGDDAALEGRRYSVWAAGGGGHVLGGQSATGIFHAAALQLATPEQPAVLVAGGNHVGELPSSPALRVVRSLPHPALMTLIHHASLVVCGGGDLMGQALALRRNIVAVPVAKDQPPRIRACLQRGLVRTASPEPTDIAAQARAALATPLTPQVRESNGLQRALADVARLLGLEDARAAE